MRRSELSGSLVVDVLLGEEVPVGAAVLQGHAVAPGAHAVARHGQRAVVVGQRRVLHHSHVPQESVGLALGLQGSPGKIHIHT